MVQIAAIVLALIKIFNYVKYVILQVTKTRIARLMWPNQFARENDIQPVQIHTKLLLRGSDNFSKKKEDS